MQPLGLTNAFELCRKRAIESIREWSDDFLLEQLQVLELVQELSDDLFIFFRFDTARAVNQNAAGFERFDEFPRDRQLSFLHPRKIIRL